MSEWRDMMCGEVRPEHVGRKLTLSGWAARTRDHGGLVFVDLRDRAGSCQLVINPANAPEAHALSAQLRNEFVVRVSGELVRRSPDAVNPNIPTGELELQVETLEIVSKCPPIPFQLDEEGVDETLRLRYRWLDLRRERLQRNIALRAKMVWRIRQVMEEAGFLDIQTPILAKPTPEGARDFLVPSRLSQGRFFALPQSPQIYKQLLMIAGFDRYYQIAICFRDEDLRADRVQEITQLDVELAFPDQEALFALMERMVSTVWRECIGVELPTPFRRMDWDEADVRYGSDKPDLRFGLEIEDATEMTRGSGFGVFAGAEAVRFLRIPRELSRGELTKLEEVAKEWGAKGLAYVIFAADGEVRSPIAKFLSAAELAAIHCEPGHTVVFGAAAPAMVSRVLGNLRLHIGRELGLIDESLWLPCWITDFPMFEWDEDDQRYGAVHHPFTRPRASDEHLLATDPGAAKAHAYDLTLNGVEIGGGSFRIYEHDLQARVFDILRIGGDEQRTKFGFLLDALSMGAPPMAGIAFGMERMMMLLAGESNLRDVIAFPKNQAGSDPMTGAPSDVDERQLAELGIRLALPKTAK